MTSVLFLFGLYVLGPYHHLPQDPSPDGPGVQVTYLANEGVLLQAGGKKVLIDGLFRQSYKEYHVLDPGSQQEAESAQGVFAAIDLILVTHRHRDHFDPQAVGLHLSRNPKGILVAAQQVIDALKHQYPDFTAIQNRVRAVTPEPGTAESIEVKGINLEVLALPHGGRPWSDIENLGFLVQLGGQWVLHIGDADTDPAHYAPFRLAQRPIHIGLIPFWFLLEDKGRESLEHHIKPRYLLAIHHQAVDRDPSWDKIMANYGHRHGHFALADRPMTDITFP